MFKTLFTVFNTFYFWAMQIEHTQIRWLFIQGRHRYLSRHIERSKEEVCKNIPNDKVGNQKIQKVDGRKQSKRFDLPSLK